MDVSLEGYFGSKTKPKVMLPLLKSPTTRPNLSIRLAIEPSNPSAAIFFMRLPCQRKAWLAPFAK